MKKWWQVRKHVRAIHLGIPAIYGSFVKCPQNCRTQAVLWTHFCVDRTAGPRQFCWRHFIRTELPDLGSFMDTFPTGLTKTDRTADLGSSMDTFLSSVTISMCGAYRTAGPRQFCGHKFCDGQNCWTQAVLWTLFLRGVINPYKTADLGSFMDTFLLYVKSVHRTAGPRQF